MRKRMIDEIIDELWKIKANFEDKEYRFDYPNYGGIPKKLSRKLSSDLVDFIQDHSSSQSYHGKNYNIANCKTKSQLKQLFSRYETRIDIFCKLFGVKI